MSRVVLWPVVAGGATALLLVFWRGFFAQHAMIIGLGVAALTYSGFRTVAILRQLYSSRDD